MCTLCAFLYIFLNMNYAVCNNKLFKFEHCSHNLFVCVYVNVVYVCLFFNSTIQLSQKKNTQVNIKVISYPGWYYLQLIHNTRSGRSNALHCGIKYLAQYALLHAACFRSPCLQIFLLLFTCRYSSGTVWGGGGLVGFTLKIFSLRSC